MAKTKVTQRKPGFLCSICLVRLPTKDKWSEHLLKCGMADIQKRRFECNFCDHAFGRKIVLVKHMQRLHPGQDHCITPLESTEPEKSPPRRVEDEEDWQEDPGELLFEEEKDREAGRTYRKKTSPVLPGVKRRNTETSETVTIDVPTNEEIEREKPSNSALVVQKAPLDDQHCSCCSKKSKKAHAETQTDTNLKAGKSHQKIIRVTRKFQKDGETVERFEEDIWND